LREYCEEEEEEEEDTIAGSFFLPSVWSFSALFKVELASPFYFLALFLFS
tara:strand:- start:1720 stop:1869 length:150 start_codon:yes stop_codon:yes gene_type:complete